MVSANGAAADEVILNGSQCPQACVRTCPREQVSELRRGGAGLTGVGTVTMAPWEGSAKDSRERCWGRAGAVGAGGGEKGPAPLPTPATGTDT